MRGAGGHVSCDFDGYVSTSGRHEGIDFSYQNGAAVYALCDGEITNVVNGYEGSGGLSPIAVYYAPMDKTVIYLHTRPLSGLTAGQVISRGQQIATQSWRGVSTAGDGYIHVEVRNGWAQNAHYSVGDNNLENDDPYPFWEVEYKERGYYVSVLVTSYKKKYEEAYDDTYVSNTLCFMH